MKIGIVCPYNIYRFGGVQEAVLAHAEHLRNRGHVVSIIAPATKSQPTKTYPDVLNIGKSIEMKTPLKTTADFSYKADKVEIAKLFKEQKFDVLHFHEPWVPMLSKQLLTQAHKLNIPVVATFHAMLPKSVRASAIKKLMLPYAKPIISKIDRLVAVSQAAALNIKSLSKQEIQIIPNAIDPNIYNPKKYSDHPLCQGEQSVILYIGRLETRKGVEHLIKAVAKINQDGELKPKLIIVGDGPLKNELMELAYGLGIYDVVFLGFVELEEKMQLLKGCDVFCSPALYGESFGIVLIEAMAMSKPVIAGNNPGYSGILTGSGSAGLVNPKETKAFSALLEKALTSADFKKKLTNWGKQEVKKYTYDKVVDSYERVFKELVENRK